MKTILALLTIVALLGGGVLAIDSRIADQVDRRARVARASMAEIRSDVQAIRSDVRTILSHLIGAR